MSEHDHHHDHDHEHGEDGHGMSVYQFVGNLLAYPMDETLLFNVGDPRFWTGMRGRLDNPRTHDALDDIEAAVAVLAEIPEDRRKMALDAEYAQAFLLEDAPMPPVEYAYHAIDENAIYSAALELGVVTSINRFLPDEHIANELFMLVPLDSGAQPSAETLAKLATFFEEHPMKLLRAMLENEPDRKVGSGFYRAIVEFALAWMRWDLEAYEEN